jgi:CBS domain-containing protein
MTSREVQMDAMLRHLGAAYYESLHGRASAADVARARAAIEESMAEQTGTAARPGRGKKQAGTPPAQAHHHGRWHSTVRDVMTTDVVTVDRITPYKEIAQLLGKHKISAVPVLIMGRHVAGVVSEADLLAAQDQAARKARDKATAALDAPPVRAASEADGRGADDQAGDHDPSGRCDPAGRGGDAQSPRQEAAGGRSGGQADRHRGPA